MKKTVLFCLALFSLVIVNGCFMETLWVVSTAMSAKTAYNGYETLTGMKNVRDNTRVFGDYRTAFVSVDIQPRKGSPDEVGKVLESVYSKSLTEMARETGRDLVCYPYDLAQVKASSDALIIQVRETKPSFWGKIMSGNKIHATIIYTDKRSAKNLAEEEYGGVFTNYEEMARTMTRSALYKLKSPDDLRRNAPSDRTYPIMTVKEKTVLLHG